MPRDLLSAVGLKAQLATAISEAAKTGKAQRIGDGDGLMLVVRPNGEASWLLRYSLNGARRDFTIGRWPAVTLKGARERADEARGKVATGVSPTDERKTERRHRVALAGSSDTVRQLMEDWLDVADNSAVYRGNIEAAFEKDVLPKIGARGPHLVERADVLKILRAIEDRGALVLVRKVRMWLRQMFEFGIDDERRPLLTASPVPGGKLLTFKARKTRGHFPAITNAREVADLMNKIRRTDQWTIRTALLLSAYLFQRPSEIREAAWDELDLVEGVWRIPAERMKLRGEHWVPLAPQVVDLLKQHQGVVGAAGLVFPGRKYGKPLSEGTLQSRINAMGYKGRHCPHGFRAMARTIIDEKLRIDPRLIEKQLSHEDDSDRHKGAYDRTEFWEERVTMMAAWADWLDAQT